MNWWFPAPTADNNVYTDSGTTDPFYVWGAHGWGGQLSGMERSDGGSALVEAVGPEPGKIHDAIYASHKGKQAFFSTRPQVLGGFDFLKSEGRFRGLNFRQKILLNHAASLLSLGGACS